MPDHVLQRWPDPGLPAEVAGWQITDWQPVPWAGWEPMEDEIPERRTDTVPIWALAVVSFLVGMAGCLGLVTLMR